MIKFICPDLNDYGLIHCIRQACIQGKYHIECVKKYIGVSTTSGYLKFDYPLDTFTAKYLVGEMILSDEYKTTKLKPLCMKSKTEIDFEKYKRMIVKDVDRILAIIDKSKKDSKSRLFQEHFINIRRMKSIDLGSDKASEKNKIVDVNSK